MADILPVMRYVREDGVVVMPAIEGDKIVFKEIPSDHPFHEQMSHEKRFSPLPKPVLEEDNVELKEEKIDDVVDFSEKIGSVIGNVFRDLKIEAIYPVVTKVIKEISAGNLIICKKSNYKV